MRCAGTGGPPFSWGRGGSAPRRSRLAPRGPDSACGGDRAGRQLLLFGGAATDTPVYTRRAAAPGRPGGGGVTSLPKLTRLPRPPARKNPTRPEAQSPVSPRKPYRHGGALPCLASGQAGLRNQSRLSAMEITACKFAGWKEHANSAEREKLSSPVVCPDPSAGLRYKHTP